MQRALDRQHEVLDRIYAAAFDDLAMQNLARTIARAIGTDDAAVAVRRGLEMEGLSITAAPESAALYTSYYWRVDPWTPAILALPPGLFTCGDELVPQQVLERSEFFNDFARPTGVLSPLSGWLALEDGACVTVSLSRPDAVEFSEEERRATAEIAHHVRRSLQLRKRLDAANARTDIARMALDAVSFGLALVDDAARVVVANAAFERLAQSGAGIRLTRGRLTAQMDQGADILGRLVSRAARARISGACRLDGPDGTPLLSVIVAPAGPDNVFKVGGGRHAIVAVSPVSVADPLASQLLEQLFGLTPAEADIAAGLWSGRPPHEIAKGRGVRITTLRTQIDSIYRKTGAATQQGLMSLLGALPRVR